MKAFALCLGLACATVLPLARAQAQSDGMLESREAIRLQHEVEELRHDVQTLRDQLAQRPAGGGDSSGNGGSALGSYQQGAPPPDANGADLTAQLLSRVQRLEDDMRALRGRIDEVDNARQRQYDDLNKQIGDLNFKLGNGAAPDAGAAGGAGPTPLSPQPGNLAAETPDAGKPPPPPPPPVPKRTPEMLLQEGNAAFARKDYALAINNAKAVLAGNPGPRAADAQFLMARALYAKRDYASAAVAYDDTYKRGRKGLRAPDSLIGLAASLSAIGEKAAACQAMQRLATEFPTLRQDLRTPAANVRREAGCR